MVLTQACTAPAPMIATSRPSGGVTNEAAAPAGGWRQSKLGFAVQRSPPPVSVPAKSVAGRDVLSQVKLVLAPFPPFLAGFGVIRPFCRKNQNWGLVFGIGKRLKNRSKPGYGEPGAPPAPLSNRTRIEGWLWNRLRAAS